MGRPASTAPTPRPASACVMTVGMVRPSMPASGGLPRSAVRLQYTICLRPPPSRNAAMSATRLPRRRLLPAALLVLLASGPSRADDALAFGTDVQPLLKTYCVACHNPKKKRGGLDLARFSGGADVPGAAGVWEQVA